MAQKPRDVDPYTDMRHYLGVELRIWRTHRAMSQQRLADQIPCHRSLLSLAEAGNHLLTAEMLARCDAILETGGALKRLWRWAEDEGDDPPKPHSPTPEAESVPRGGRPGECPSAQEAEDEMKRRNLLRALGVGTALSPVTLEALSQVRGAIDRSLAGGGQSGALLAHWEAAAHRYGYGYQGRTPTDVLRDALLDLSDVHSLWGTLRSADARKRLSRVCAQLAGVAAIVLHDLGHDRDAHAWFGTAVASAAESGDPRLHAWLLAREAMVPLNYSRPVGAVGVATAARRMAGPRPSAAAALAAAVQARAYASLGRASEARDAIRDAEWMATELSAEQSADTWFGYPAQKHAVHASRAYTLIGDTGAAEEAQREALRLARSTSVMSPALIRLDASACVARQGDHEAACAAAVATLTGVPRQYRGGLVVERAREVGAAVPPSARAMPAVRELREALADVERPGRGAG